MNLAYDYWEKEIERLDKIIDSSKKMVADVEGGRSNLISSAGITHTNTSNVKNYIKLKQNQKSKLIHWQQYVVKYI